MALIYKYCHDYGVQFLETRKLMFSPPIKFDDPFELRPQPGDATLSIDDSNVLLGDDARMKELFDSWRLHNPAAPVKSFDEWLKPYRANPRKFNAELAKVMPEMIENFCPYQLEKISKQYGMACFSETFSDVRMWSHYADEHKGVVVGLDSDSLGINLLQVTCESERVAYTASQFANPKSSWVLKLLTTKSEDWNYQKEWRAILRFGTPPLTFDEALDAYVFEVLPQTIKRVLIGCNATEATVAAVQTILVRVELSVIPERARPHRSAFKMDFAPVVWVGGKQ